MAEKETKPKATAKPTTEKKTTAKKATTETKSKTTEAKPKTTSAEKKTTVEKKTVAKKTTAPKEESQVNVTVAVAEKPTKQPKARTSKTKNSSGGVAAMMQNHKIRFLAIAAVVLILILALVLGLVFGLKKPNGTLPGDLMEIPSSIPEMDVYNTTNYATNTKVLFAAEVKGTVDRVKPVAETKNERAAFDTAALGDIFKDKSRYPTYGSTLRHVIGTEEAQVAARTAILNESEYLCSYNTANAGHGAQTAEKYTRIDKDGFLYQWKDGQWIHSLEMGANGTPKANSPENYRLLYKHDLANGLYLEGYARNGVTYEISDNAPAVVKTVSMRPRGYGYSITGLYAPAGEVIKVEISGADMNATNGITVHIGQALYNGQANNIWVAKNQMQRSPLLLNTLNLNKSTCEYDEATDTWTGYIGSFIGGPIYIRNNSAEFSATISGGLEYLHFILGYTTQAEFNRIKSDSLVPYFDLEVCDRGVLHSGPRYYAENYSYDDLYKAAVLWDKVATVTTTNSYQGIVFLYDAFVAAGAAVAFPGRMSVNCPLDWMSSALNYNGIVTSGDWGNFHEYHHNFQGYGVGDGGEVTNNGLTLVSYALFTKISANRGMNNFGAQGLSGWNTYTSATWALNDVLKIARPNEEPGNGNKGLALYATLLHNFGADAYTNTRRGGQSYAGYMGAWQDYTHNNMYYYFNEILQGGVNNTAPANYPMFVPVSSVYQTGRSYLYDGTKKYFQTMQPYVIPYGDAFTVDLRKYTAPGGQYASGSVVLPDGFTYEITGFTQPSNGTFTETNTKGVFTYTPDTSNKNLKSGQIYVTLQLTKTDGAFTVAPIDLVLEFEQSHETTKMTLNRTTYTYEANNMFTDAVTAFNANFGNYKSVVTANQSNPTQNANTDIWFYPDNEQNRNDHPNAPESYFIHDNQIDVIDGKLYCPTDGTYRIYLRGRDNCALYFSLNGATYTLGAKITESTATYGGATYTFRLDSPETYFDITYKEGNVTVVTHMGEDKTSTYTIQMNDNKKYDNWLYIKEVLIDHKSPNISFIGVGSNQWTQTMFTLQETYHKADNSTVASTDEDGYAYTKTTYFDQDGKDVAYTRKDKGSNELQYFVKIGNAYRPSNEETVSKLTESKLLAPTSANYANAYRFTYEFPDNKGFQTDYFYRRSYSLNYTDNVHQNPTQELLDTNYKASDSWNWNNFKGEYLVDGDRNTFIHSNRQATATNPFTFLIDMGEAKAVNRMVMYTQYRGGNGDWLAPKSFKLEGSLDGIEFFTVGEFFDVPRVNTSITVNFEEKTFRYYRLTVTHSDRLLMIGEIEMWRINEVNGGTQLTPDDSRFTYDGVWSGAKAESTFGHVMVGVKNAKVSFEFEGTQLGLLASTAYGQDLKVTIDGKVVTSMDLKEDKSPTPFVFLSEKLEEGKHTVTVECGKEGNIDSFVIFP